MSIEFKENSVCFADGQQWYFDNYFSGCVNFSDFQLNTVKQGDYIPKSELDTEYKYNRAVEVFGLFGFKFKASAISEHEEFGKDDALSCLDDCLWQCGYNYHHNERKITFNQLMAIGELKRMMNERDSALIDAVENTNILSEVLNSSEETELKSRAMVSELERQGDEWPKVGDDATMNDNSRVTVRCVVGEFAWCECPTSSMQMITVHIYNLRKPKSKEDLLIEELQTKLVKNDAVDSWMLAANIINGKIKGLSYKGDL